MAQFTPGPWQDERWPTKYPDLFTYSISQTEKHEGESHRYGIVGGIDCPHNAALIAAAPELYGFAVAALEHFDGTDAPLAVMARAVLAKAGR